MELLESGCVRPRQALSKPLDVAVFGTEAQRESTMSKREHRAGVGRRQPTQWIIARLSASLFLPVHSFVFSGFVPLSESP
jgi:hypothetical protein